jgi:hypothetical protein
MTAITKNAPANLSLAGLVQQATAQAAAAEQAEALVVSTTLVESANGRHMLRATLGGLPLTRSEFIKQYVAASLAAMFGEVPDAIKLEDVFVMDIGDQRFKLVPVPAQKAMALAIYSLSAGKRDPNAVLAKREAQIMLGDSVDAVMNSLTVLIQVCQGMQNAVMEKTAMVEAAFGGIPANASEIAETRKAARLAGRELKVEAASAHDTAVATARQARLDAVKAAKETAKAEKRAAAEAAKAVKAAQDTAAHREATPKSVAESGGINVADVRRNARQQPTPVVPPVAEAPIVAPVNQAPAVARTNRASRPAPRTPKPVPAIPGNMLG